MDGDSDGKGEFGTLSELLGLASLRVAASAESDVRGRGTVFPAAGGVRIEKYVLTMGDMDRDSGVLAQFGYVFHVFLPDTGSPSRWVSEKWDTRSGIVTIQGSGRVDSELSEEYWCAYAKPLEWGTTGRSVFFSGSDRVRLRSQNRSHRIQGMGRVDPASAFLGDCATSPIAAGTRGRDGELWEVID